MIKLCQAFNHVNQRFGSNRVKLIAIDPNGHLDFHIDGFAGFSMCYVDGHISVMEFTRDGYRSTASAQWIAAIATGKRRDEQGNMVA